MAGSKRPQFVAPTPKGVIPHDPAGQWDAESARFSGASDGTTRTISKDERFAAAAARRNGVPAVAEHEDEDEDFGELDLESELDRAMAPPPIEEMAQPSAADRARMQGKAPRQARQAAPVPADEPPPPPPVVDDGPQLAFWRSSDEDLDRLWDWLRADSTGDFFGFTFKTSRQLVQAINGLEVQHVFLSIYLGDQHLGFFAIAPVIDGLIGALHIYLQPKIRGELGPIAAALLPLVTAQWPGLKLAVHSQDPAWTRLHRSVLLPLGFAEHTLFVR